MFSPGTLVRISRESLYKKGLESKKEVTGPSKAQLRPFWTEETFEVEYVDNFHRIFLDNNQLTTIYGKAYTSQAPIAFYSYELQAIPKDTAPLSATRNQATMKEVHPKLGVKAEVRASSVIGSALGVSLPQGRGSNPRMPISWRSPVRDTAGTE